MEALWKDIAIVSYWVTLPLHIPLLVVLFTILNFVGLLSLKFIWIIAKVFPLALKMIILNSVTAVPVYRVLNNSYGVTGTI